METIIIHNLYRYKICYVSEQAIETTSGNSKEKLESGKGFENKIESIHFQDPTRGWTKVRNSQLAFEIADTQRSKISRSYLKEINPSPEFLEQRRRSKKSEEKPRKKRKKKNG